MYKHRTELLTGKCWKGHFSKALNSSIPTPLPIRTVHKYPFSFFSKDLEGGLSTVPSRVGGTFQETSLVREGRAQYQLYVALEGGAQLSSLYSLALEILKT